MAMSPLNVSALISPVTPVTSSLPEKLSRFSVVPYGTLMSKSVSTTLLFFSL